MSCTSSCVDSCGTEGLPNNSLTDVGGNEKGNTRTQTVALLKELVQQQDDQTCDKELKTQAALFRDRLSRWAPSSQHATRPKGSSRWCLWNVLLCCNHQNIFIFHRKLWCWCTEINLCYSIWFLNFLKAAMIICINLNDDEQADPSPHLWRVSIHPSHDINNGLSNGDDHSKHCTKETKKNSLTYNVVANVTKSGSFKGSKTFQSYRNPTFLSSVEEGSVLWGVSHLNDFSTSQQLHDEAWGDDGRYTQLHKSTWTTGKVKKSLWTTDQK